MTTIGFSTPVLPNTVIQAMLRGLASAAARRGGRVLATDAALDVAKQAGDITRLLKTAPKAKGLAAPGMPAGSPGMEGPRSDAYSVLLFDDKGNSTVFKKYPGN